MIRQQKLYKVSVKSIVYMDSQTLRKSLYKCVLSRQPNFERSLHICCMCGQPNVRKSLYKSV